ncbi:MAG: EF-hand domain-containing protein [Geminicoccaceae bacterium]
MCPSVRLGILAGLVMLVAPAMAADPAPARRPALLAAADSDGDGKLTAAELHAERERQVTQFDTDRDGKLSPGEYEAWWLSTARPRLERLFRADDRDKDGSVALEELVARANDLLHRRDRDGDGALTAEELRPRRRAANAAAPAAAVTAPVPPAARSG